MADKENENLDATTAENVDAKETVSEEPSTEDTSVEASESSEASSEESVAEEVPAHAQEPLQLLTLQTKPQRILMLLLMYLQLKVPLKQFLLHQHFQLLLHLNFRFLCLP